MAQNDDNKDSKTEDATPHKREELKKKGQVAQSKEIGSALLLLTAAVFFYFYGASFVDQLLNVARDIFMRVETFRISSSNATVLFKEILIAVGTMIAPLLLVCVCIGLLANVLQTGIIISGENLKLKLEKINPIDGFKRLFSIRSSVEAIKAIIKLTIIGLVVYKMVKGEIEGSVLLINQTPGESIRFIGMAIFKTVMYVAVLMMVMAIFDFLYQRLKFERDIRMSKQEVKEELKEREGDPNVKARIKSLQRQMATRRMIDDVPKAQVVITNPTHLAIAIQYTKDMPAPKVVAKGADYLAEKIRNIAREKNIPLVENKILARTLYKMVKVGGYVPENLYNAVAEVLVYVMKLRDDFSKVFTGEELGSKTQTLNT